MEGLSPLSLQSTKSIKCRPWTDGNISSRLITNVLGSLIHDDKELKTIKPSVAGLLECYGSEEYTKLYCDIDIEFTPEDGNITSEFKYEKNKEMIIKLNELIETIQELSAYDHGHNYVILTSSRIIEATDKKPTHFKYSKHLIFNDLHLKTCDIPRLQSVFVNEIADKLVDGQVYNATGTLRPAFGTKYCKRVQKQRVSIYNKGSRVCTIRDVNDERLQKYFHLTLITNPDITKSHLMKLDGYELPVCKSKKKEKDNNESIEWRESKENEQGWEKYIDNVKNKHEASVYRRNLRILFSSLIPEECKHYRGMCHFVSAFQYLEDKLNIEEGELFMVWIESRNDILGDKDYIARFKSFDYTESEFNPKTFFNNCAKKYGIKHASDMAIVINEAHLDFINAQSRPPFEDIDDLVTYIKSFMEQPLNATTRMELADKLYRCFATTMYNYESAYILKEWDIDNNKAKYIVRDIKTNRGEIFWGRKLENIIWCSEKEKYEKQRESIEYIFSANESQIDAKVRYGSIFDKINANNTINLTEASNFDIEKDDNYDAFSVEFTKYMKTVFLGNEDDDNVDYLFNFMISWFRRMHIERKQTGRILIVTGAPGIGKSLLFGRVPQQIAKKSIKTLATLDRLSDNFTDMDDSLVCLLFEEIAYTKSQRKHIEIMKDISASGEMVCRTKYLKDRTYKNNVSIAILSNSGSPILVEDMDRRFVQFNVKCGTLEENLKTGGEFYDLMMNNISNFLYFIDEHGSRNWVREWQTIEIHTKGIETTKELTAAIRGPPILYRLVEKLNKHNIESKHQYDIDSKTFDISFNGLRKILKYGDGLSIKQMKIDMINAGFKKLGKQVFNDYKGKRRQLVRYTLDGAILRSPTYDLADAPIITEQTDIYDMIKEDSKSTNMQHTKMLLEFSGNINDDDDVIFELNQHQP